MSSDGTARHRKSGADRGRSRWVTAGLGGLLLAGAAAAAILVSQHRTPQTRTSPTTPPPPAVSARMDLPVVVIGADCAVLGAAAVTETGAPAYCARADSQSAASVWSVQPETLRTAAPQSPPTS